LQEQAWKMVDASSSTSQQQQQRAELAQHFGRGLPEDVQSEGGRESRL
jgi:hypothetical protein